MPDDQTVGRLLEALDRNGGLSEMLPTVEGISGVDVSNAADTAERLGYIRAKVSRNAGDQLMAIFDVRLTASGKARIQEHRRAISHGSSNVAANAHPDSSLESRQTRRTSFIRSVYETANGSEGKFVDGPRLGDTLGWPRQETDDVMRYWEGEGVIRYITEEGVIGLTHRGVVEIEGAISNPAVPTTHFAPYSIVIHGDVHGSQIMANSPGAIQVSASPQTSEADLVNQFLAALKAALVAEPLSDPSARVRIEQLLAVMETEKTQDEPDGDLQRSVLQVFRDFAIGVASGGAWTGVVALAHQLAH